MLFVMNNSIVTAARLFSFFSHMFLKMQKIKTKVFMKVIVLPLFLSTLVQSLNITLPNYQYEFTRFSVHRSIFERWR